MGAQAKPAVPVLIYYKELNAKRSFFFENEHIVEALAKIAPDDPIVTKYFAVWLVQDLTGTVQERIAKALPRMADGKIAIGALVQTYQASRSAQVRAGCVRALGELGGGVPAVVAVLNAARTDSDASVREVAKAALAKVQK
jgi:HEAT repeat protein